MIEVLHLTKRYRRTTAISDLTFRVGPGLVTGFLGPNGAGKTTTMRLILGLGRPTAGTATVDGRAYAELPRPLTTLGTLLDAQAVNPRRDGFHHLLALAQSNGIGARRVRETLDLVGLAEVAHRPTGGWSLGMKQRLGIAAALLGDPAGVMLDEPLNGLDPEGIVWLRGLLRRLADEGRVVLLSSHLMSEMALIADHLVVIGRGRLIADSPTTTLLRDRVPASMLVRAEGADAFAELLRGAGASVDVEPDGALRVHGLDGTGVGRLAARHRVVVTELTPVQPSLENAFIDLTRDSVEYAAPPSAMIEDGAR
ncbi:ATP-binding cassette domain-containing protein [Micromonospora sp. WMMD1128]|uniref:ATP-binding cassette domain-containing protein n=1 Tax=unclassified Micromonospora TaxID=2617518 RepID=UPI00248BD250|nr:MULTISPECIES: ATP-binding cassette domain-containing protein [unclassified Micromonospora]WBB71307.1 ATP-binding cassette domain-containing protein [Micromonospora sp. WMMD1128]WFE35224.1 ATP-binding cassette domain-containing protein [Micromonospora sp. WMMD975]